MSDSATLPDGYAYYGEQTAVLPKGFTYIDESGATLEDGYTYVSGVVFFTYLIE